MSIDARFAEFDDANPAVWRLFVRFASEAIVAGREHYSADAIVHRIRWHVNVETRSADEFKINNDFTSRYARKFAATFPEWGGFFVLRALADEPPEPGPFGRGQTLADEARRG